ncbi:spindle pole body component 97-like [Zophobas morio]|uniref:spindle pole body component 97-like n=1 Tax=Zophobas morio TaxID=2755281 RepID=UPI003082FCD8
MTLEDWGVSNFEFVKTLDILQNCSNFVSCGLAEEIITKEYKKYSSEIIDVLVHRLQLDSKLKILNQIFFLTEVTFIDLLVLKVEALFKFPLPILATKIEQLLAIEYSNFFHTNETPFCALNFCSDEVNKFAFGKWRSISITAPEFPPVFYILFSKDSLVFFKDVFAFLLSLKQVLSTLQENWRSARNSANREDARKVDPFWIQRWRMTHFAEQLFLYLTEDVLRFHFEKFTSNVNNKDSVDDIKNSYEIFLNVTKTQLFLCKIHITNTLAELFECCHKFCSSTSVEKRKEAGEGFNKQYRLLLRILNGLKNSTETGVSLLLERIN